MRLLLKILHGPRYGEPNEKENARLNGSRDNVSVTPEFSNLRGTKGHAGLLMPTGNPKRMTRHQFTPRVSNVVLQKYGLASCRKAVCVYPRRALTTWETT